MDVRTTRAVRDLGVLKSHGVHPGMGERRRGIMQHAFDKLIIYTPRHSCNIKYCQSSISQECPNDIPLHAIQVFKPVQEGTNRQDRTPQLQNRNTNQALHGTAIYIQRNARVELQWQQHLLTGHAPAR